VILAMVAGVGPTRGQDAALAPAQREEVAKLMTAFRQGRSTPKSRPAIVEKLLKFGAPAVKQLSEVIDAELQTAMEPYHAALVKQAAEVFKKQAAGTMPETIRKLQTAVLALRTQGDLTKETIVRTADPAMQQLADVALVDSGKVLKSSSKLASQRARLLEIGRHWERCAAYDWEHAPASEAKPAAPPRFADYLRAHEELAALLTTPLDKEAQAVLASNAKLAARLEAEEAKAVLHCNLARILLGLRPLAIDLKLAAAARDHSADMQRLGFFDHLSPVSGKRTPDERARRFGTTGDGENIYMGRGDGAHAHDVWFHSPGHFRNLLSDDYRRIGVGRHQDHFTQMFGR
jgi:uncharacterized protein YkwD